MTKVLILNMLLNSVWIAKKTSLRTTCVKKKNYKFKNFLKVLQWGLYHSNWGISVSRGK